MQHAKLLALGASTLLSFSVSATDYTLTTSTDTSTATTLSANDTATVASDEKLGGATTNANDDILLVNGDSTSVTINGLFHGGEDLIKATSANTGLTITVGTTGKLIATENGSGNAYDAIDLNGDGSGVDYSGANGLVSTNATITNNGTIWVADKHAIDATDSVGATITNTGTMSARDDTINAIDVSNITITNSGTISADSDSITYNTSQTEAKNTTTDNTAAIAFYGDNSTVNEVSSVFYSDGLTLTNESGGTITADYSTIQLYDSSTAKAKNVSITNHGTISATKAATANDTDGAIYAEFVEGFTLNNTGTISAKDDTIDLQSASGAISITNSGIISSEDDFTIAAGNITAAGSSFTLTNSGTISAAGSFDAVYLDSTNKAITITNSGTISTAGTNAIDGDATTNLTITNTGTLSAANQTVYMATGGALTNSGTIKATTVSNPAIYIDGANNTVTLEKGSVIIGDIEFKSSASSNTLKMDTGSARSYVYSVTDNSTTWTLTDLDGRSAIQGSAKAAGIGNVETADEALFNRSNAINNSLSRYARTNSKQDWADVYVGAAKREADSTAVNEYQQNLAGVTLVRPQGAGSQMIVALQRANMDIDNNTQDIDATSISVGLQKANAFKDFTGRVMLSYNDYDSSQEVLDNTSSTGYTTYTGDYDSIGLTLGLGKTHQHGDVTVTLNGEIAHERIDDYSETATFAWKKRNITQATVSASGEWNKTLGAKDVFVNAGVTARGLIAGKKANYTIDSTSASFDGGNQSEVIATAGLGVDYNLDKDAVARFEVLGGYSNRKTASASIATTLDWKF